MWPIRRSVGGCDVDADEAASRALLSRIVPDLLMPELCANPGQTTNPELLNEANDTGVPQASLLGETWVGGVKDVGTWRFRPSQPQSGHCW